MRGKQITRRPAQPDRIHHSELVSKLINYVMYDGKKKVAEAIIYQTLEDLSAKTKASPVEALEKAVDNVRPKLEVRARRVGGSNYQVPVPVNPDRQVTLVYRWIIDAARKHRGSRDFWQSLSAELQNAFKGEGDAVRKRDDIQRMAESNRAFAQFA